MKILISLIVAGALTQQQPLKIPSEWDTSYLISQRPCAPSSITGSQVSNEDATKSLSIVVSAVAAFIAAISVIANIVQYRRNRRDLVEWKTRDAAAASRAKLLDSLVWFDGAEHKRSIGISIIEGHWRDRPELVATWMSVLSVQAKQIINAGANRDFSEAALRDLKRIADLIRSFGSIENDPVSVRKTLDDELDDVVQRLSSEEAASWLTQDRVNRLREAIAKIGADKP